jgi:hypothetical protein
VKEVVGPVAYRVALVLELIQFGKKGKLGLRYVSPYVVKEVVGPVAYRVALAPELAGVHDVFQVVCA